MTVNVEVDISEGRVRPITVPATAVTVPIISAAYTLNGWSLQDAGSSAPQEVEGSVVSPGAGATIAQIAILGSGLYVIKWQVQLIGAAAAADQDNFQLQGLSGGAITSENAGAAGQYGQPDVEDFVAAIGSVKVVAIAAGTVGVTYAAQITAEPVGQESSIAQITSGQDVVAVISVPRNGVDTRWFSDTGILVKGDLTLTMVQGTLKGAIWARWWDGPLRY